MVSESKSVKALENGLIVSCQASSGEPLCKPEHILALCLTVINGGATALRLEGVENIALLRKNTDLPIIGITKTHGLTTEQCLERAYITPSFAEARQVSLAGADIIAIDATGRERLDGLSLEETIEKIHNELQKPVWADIATFEEGIAAARAGADIVSTTLFGYTSYSCFDDYQGPAIDLVARLSKTLDKTLCTPVILEGRVWTPEEVEKAMESGAYAVVVGSAITRPHLITRRFRDALARSGTSSLPQ
ncbi:MAG: N-acetylmannosamine-6-phosphate 2-epimerase [Candidatus Obscuribacterales bacterium]|nr:N-acetylmannosamine-6-phosphate 2-epimerase [Candidatus Obscuribacterales bacterium]